MIEESEKLKSTAEDKASRMADRLVPYTLGGTALTYLLTRNVTKDVYKRQDVWFPFYPLCMEHCITETYAMEIGRAHV